jgi:hypothetical protein
MYRRHILSTLCGTVDILTVPHKGLYGWGWGGGGGEKRNVTLCTLPSPTHTARAGIFKQSMGARNRVGIGLSYQPAKLHGLAKLVNWTP